MLCSCTLHSRKWKLCAPSRVDNSVNILKGKILLKRRNGKTTWLGSSTKAKRLPCHVERKLGFELGSDIRG